MLEVGGIAGDVARRIEVAELAAKLGEPLTKLRFLPCIFGTPGQVAGFAGIGREVVQLPGLRIVPVDELPPPGPDSAMAADAMGGRKFEILVEEVLAPARDSPAEGDVDGVHPEEIVERPRSGMAEPRAHDAGQDQHLRPAVVGERLDELGAISIVQTAAGAVSIMLSTCPPIRSVMAGPEPR